MCTSAVCSYSDLHEVGDIDTSGSEHENRTPAKKQSRVKGTN